MKLKMLAAIPVAILFALASTANAQTTPPAQPAKPPAAKVDDKAKPPAAKPDQKKVEKPAAKPAQKKAAAPAKKKVVAKKTTKRMTKAEQAAAAKKAAEDKAKADKAKAEAAALAAKRAEYAKMKPADRGAYRFVFCGLLDGGKKPDGCRYL